MTDALLYPLFLWPVLAGLVVGIGITVRVYRRWMRRTSDERRDLYDEIVP